MSREERAGWEAERGNHFTSACVVPPAHLLKANWEAIGRSTRNIVSALLLPQVVAPREGMRWRHTGEEYNSRRSYAGEHTVILVAARIMTTGRAIHSKIIGKKE